MSEERPNEISTAESSAAGWTSTGAQEHRFARPFRLIEEAIALRVFPGAALAVTLRGALLAWRALDASPTSRIRPLWPGLRLNTAAGREPGDCEAMSRARLVWDLASLTKPIATTSMAMLLCERGKLSLDAKVVDAISREFGGTGLLHRDMRAK